MEYTEFEWVYPKKLYKTKFKGAIQNYVTATGTIAVLFTPDFACVIGDVGDTYTASEMSSRGGVLAYSFADIRDFSNCFIIAEVMRDENTTRTLDVVSDSDMATKYGFNEGSVNDILKRLSSIAHFGEYEVTSNF